MNLTKHIVVLNQTEFLHCIQRMFPDQFQENTNTKYVIHAEHAYIHFQDDRSLTIYIDNDRKLLTIELRRYYSSRQPDHKMELPLFTVDIEYALQSIVAKKFEELKIE